MIGSTGKCSAYPSLHEHDVGNMWSCALEGKDPCKEGNHIKYSVSGPPNRRRLDIISVWAEYCKPKPEPCRCSKLMDSVLSKYPELQRITGQFDANPFIKGCNCYLGAAARANFRFVKFQSSKEECSRQREFNSNTYRGICEQYVTMKCTDGIGEVTK